MTSNTVFDEESCYRSRQDFPSLARRIDGQPIAYLDGPGGTQVPKPVLDAMIDCYHNRTVSDSFRIPTYPDQRQKSQPCLPRE